MRLAATTTATPSFDSVWAKVERAKEHGEALERHITETFEVKENCPRVGAKFDPERGKNVVFISERPDLSDFFERTSLILGKTPSTACARRSITSSTNSRSATGDGGSASTRPCSMFADVLGTKAEADARTHIEGRRSWEQESAGMGSPRSAPTSAQSLSGTRMTESTKRSSGPPAPTSTPSSCCETWKTRTSIAFSTRCSSVRPRRLDPAGLRNVRTHPCDQPRGVGGGHRRCQRPSCDVPKGFVRWNSRRVVATYRLAPLQAQ